MATIISIGTLLTCALVAIVHCDDCTDRFTLCLHWAKKGECDKNPKWMLNNCNAACRSDCADPKMAFTPCLDEKEKCPKWKAAGKCAKETAFMVWQCPESCGFCERKNPTDGKSYPAEVKAAVAEVKKGTGAPTTVAASTAAASTAPPAASSQSTAKTVASTAPPATGTPIPLQPGEKVKILQSHNELRTIFEDDRQKPTKPLPELTWDEKLGSAAQDRASSCDNSTVDPLSENVCIISSQPADSAALEAALFGNCFTNKDTTGWNNEKDNYHPENTPACDVTAKCNSFAKIASDQTATMGCAAANCPTIKGTTPAATTATLVICKFATPPAYDAKNQIYKKDKSVSQALVTPQAAMKTAVLRGINLARAETARTDTAKIKKTVPPSLSDDKWDEKVDTGLAATAQKASALCLVPAKINTRNYCIITTPSPLLDAKATTEAVNKCFKSDNPVAKPGWSDEIVNYQPLTGKCVDGKTCDSGVKLIATESKTVGCGFFECKKGIPATDNGVSATLLICDFATPPVYPAVDPNTGPKVYPADQKTA